MRCKLPKLKFSISTHATTGRPLIYIDSVLGTLKCLIDTGADTPVFYMGETVLKALYPDAYYKKDIKIAGFGGNGLLHPLWCIPKFEFSNGKNKIIINNLYIALVNAKNPKFDILLSITVFSRVSIELSMNRGTLIVDSARKEYNGYIAVDAESKEESFNVLMMEESIIDEDSAITAAAMRKSLESKKPNK